MSISWVLWWCASLILVMLFVGTQSKPSACVSRPFYSFSPASFNYPCVIRRLDMLPTHKHPLFVLGRKPGTCMRVGTLVIGHHTRKDICNSTILWGKETRNLTYIFIILLFLVRFCGTTVAEIQECECSGNSDTTSRSKSPRQLSFLFFFLTL